MTVKTGRHEDMNSSVNTHHDDTPGYPLRTPVRWNSEKTSYVYE